MRESKRYTKQNEKKKSNKGIISMYVVQVYIMGALIEDNINIDDDDDGIVESRKTPAIKKNNYCKYS